VHHRVQRCCELGVHGLTSQATEGTKRLQPSGHIGSRVGVYSPAAPLVTGVQGQEQIAELRTADLTNHYSVRPHPQRLAYQVRERDRAHELRVRRAGLESHNVGMVRRQLAGILDDHQPLARWDQGEQGGEQCCFARI
jgi:hypothetical protein